MTHRRAAQRRLAAAVAELGVPVPFDPRALAARLQRGRGRPVHLVPFAIAPDLFGAWIRTAAADYLYHEQQTSPFHQADTALRLAACMLLGPGHGLPLRPGTLPAAGPEPAELIPGPASPSPLTPHDTQTFAFLALQNAHRPAGQRARTRRRLRQLRPLQAAPRHAVPDTAVSSGGGRPVVSDGRPVVSARLRLHRRVIEIRSAQLALRPYQDAGLPVAAGAASRAVPCTRPTAASARWAAGRRRTVGSQRQG